MTAIATFRPLAANAEVARNQLRAIQSWQKPFNEIILFGEPEPELASPITRFVPTEDFPVMRKLLLAASLCYGTACIINADIVVAPNLAVVVANAFSRGARAATSWRYQYEPGKSLDFARVVDNGVDFFAASPDLWAVALSKMPSAYRAGHPMWDSWLLGFFNVTCKSQFADLSAARCIFHPRHGHRKTVYSIALAHDEYSNYAGMPRMKVR